MSQLRLSGGWPHKAVTNDDIIAVFFSKSAYFKEHHKIFPMVSNYPGMQKWLRNEEDAPSDAELWGSKKKSFANLKQILLDYENLQRKKKDDAASEKKGSGRKGKERQTSWSGDEGRDHHRKASSS
jgi:hypothetical protein